MTLWLPVGNWLRADGEPISGHGVEPDEAVEASPENVAQEQAVDPVLDRAGRVRRRHFGEGEYAQMDTAIQSLLASG